MRQRRMMLVNALVMAPLPHIKTTSQCAHVIRQRLFSPAVRVCEREEERESDTDQKGKDIEKGEIRN